MSIMAVCPCGLKFETEERDLVEINRLLRADGWVFGRDGVWRWPGDGRAAHQGGGGEAPPPVGEAR